MRIHEPDLQTEIFDILKITPEDAEKRFGHLLRAFQYGAPSSWWACHWSRSSRNAFAGAPNIREVITFPKNQSAQDLMLGA